MQKLLVIGGGFAGMWAALVAVREAIHHGRELEIKLVSKDPYLTMRPRLYEPDPESLRTPLMPVLEPVGIDLTVAKAEHIDPSSKTVGIIAAKGSQILAYDRLILAAGSHLAAPPVPGLAEHGWSVDDYATSVAFDRHLQALAAMPDVPGRDSFVVLGAGFTGIELALELRRRIEIHSDAERAAKASIFLVDREAVVGASLGANPRPVIEAALADAGVELRLAATVTSVEEGRVVFGTGKAIDARSVISTVGLTASPLAAQLPPERDEMGRLPTDPMLRVTGVEAIYAAGDVARAYVDDENIALMSCQHAIFMGQMAGFNAAHDLLELPLRPYRQPFYQTCLDLGRSGAVYTTGWGREVSKTGEEAKKLKRFINSELIYPPRDDRAAILAAADIDARDEDRTAAAS